VDDLLVLDQIFASRFRLGGRWHGRRGDKGGVERGDEVTVEMRLGCGFGLSGVDRLECFGGYRGFGRRGGREGTFGAGSAIVAPACPVVAGAVVVASAAVVIATFAPGEIARSFCAAANRGSARTDGLARQHEASIPALSDEFAGGRGHRRVGVSGGSRRFGWGAILREGLAGENEGFDRGLGGGLLGGAFYLIQSM
jgi:hypothetical protein